jgi:transposase-like protein
MKRHSTDPCSEGWQPLARRFDPLVPRIDCARGVPDTEDPALTQFLEAELADILSLSETPPACPKCQSTATRLTHHSQTASGRLPAFQCWTCKTCFSRTTGTPLSQINRRDRLPGFIRLLSQQKSLLLAGRELGASARLVARWTRNFRAWLLTIDPSGHWEAKVRLGIAPPLDDAVCQQCRATGTLIHHGFGNRRRDDPTRQLRCHSCGSFLLIEPRAPTVTPRPRRQRVAPLEPKILALKAAGASVAAIALELGLNQATIRTVIRHRSALARGEVIVPRRPPGRRPLELADTVLADIRARFTAGESLYAIAATHGLTYATVYRRVKGADAIRSKAGNSP